MDFEGSIDCEKTSKTGIPSLFCGLRILLVDHDTTSLLNITSSLEEHSYKVTAIQQATIALSILRERIDQFDLVMVDVNMPQVDCLEFVKSIQLIKDIPIILMSSMVKREMVEEAMAHGVCFIHLKPISTNLLKKVWHHVYRHQIKARQESEHKVNNLVEVMDNTSCANNKIQDRKGKSIMNPSKTYHDQEVDTLFEKDNAKGSKRIRSIDEESPDLEKGDHSLGSKNTMEGREKKRQAMEWTLELDKKFKEAVHMLGDKARPKLIMKIMNVPNLSRKQVSNYLQRYRVQKRQAQHVQPSTSSIVNQCKTKSPILSSLDPISHSQDGVNEECHQLKFMRQTKTSLQECLGEKQSLNIESTIGNFNSASQRLCFSDNEYHFNVLDSNEFPINFDEPLLEGYCAQPPAVPSLVPPNDFFAGINDWNQELELDNFNCASQRLYFSDDGHHFSTFNNLPDNGHHFNVFDANGFPINFNEPLQEGYSPQPPAVSSLAPPDDFFTGLDNWIQEPELNNFNGDHNVSTRSQNH